MHVYINLYTHIIQKYVYEIMSSFTNNSKLRQTHLFIDTCYVSIQSFTVCVGRRETPADFFVNDVKDVENILSRLAASPSTVSPI